MSEPWKDPDLEVERLQSENERLRERVVELESGAELHKAIRHQDDMKVRIAELRERLAELEAENEKLTKRCDMFAGTILEYHVLHPPAAWSRADTNYGLAKLQEEIKALLEHVAKVDTSPGVREAAAEALDP